MTRILIVRSSAIGDVVFASALPGAIRRAHPDAHLAWLVEPGIHELLLADPDIDEVITWPKAEWVKLWKSGRRLELLGRVRQLRRELHARRFDMALDLQGLMKSGFLTWLSGAQRRVGLGSKEGSQLLMSEVIPRGGEKARIGSEYKYLAEQFGFDAGDFLPTLKVAPDAEASVLGKLAAHGSTFGGNSVCCAGALAVLDEMDDDFLANVNERAAQLRAGLAKLPHVREVSGLGLMVGIAFDDGIKAADVRAACEKAGLLVLTAKTRLRLLPPLILTADDVDDALATLRSVLEKCV